MNAAELLRPWLLPRASAVAFAAAWRVRRAFRLPFDRLVDELCAGAPLTGALADPQLHLRVVSRLLPVLPPWAMGRCLKRSLLLLHLWSRCGLAPCLHLGVSGGGGAAQGHAWLTAEADGHTLEAGSSDGRAEAFSFPRAHSSPGTPHAWTRPEHRDAAAEPPDVRQGSTGTGGLDGGT